MIERVVTISRRGISVRKPKPPVLRIEMPSVAWDERGSSLDTTAPLGRNDGLTITIPLLVKTFDGDRQMELTRHVVLTRAD